MGGFLSGSALELMYLTSLVGVGGPDMSKNYQKILAGVIIYIVLPEARKQSSQFKTFIDYLKYLPMLSVIYRTLKKKMGEVSFVIIYNGQKIQFSEGAFKTEKACIPNSLPNIEEDKNKIASDLVSYNP